jgi:hypothetical protein
VVHFEEVEVLGQREGEQRRGKKGRRWKEMKKKKLG